MMMISFRIFILTASVAWQGPSFATDSNRFSAGHPPAANAQIAPLHLKRHPQPRAQAVSQSDQPRGMSSASDLNTNSSIFASAVIAKQPLGKLVGPLVSMNISYSYDQGRDGATTECGPSPLTVAQIEDLVSRTAQFHGVDPSLAKAIAWSESRFDRNRNSVKGARGPMQLMPRTARELGVREICDPVENIDGGIRHLKLLLEKFQNPILAAAAYNAGAQAIYDNGGVPPYGETVRYVAAVLSHQMGLQMPLNLKVRQKAAGTRTLSANETASDVIGAHGSRFVKGVMQF
jgi:hypothetical protein